MLLWVSVVAGLYVFTKLRLLRFLTISTGILWCPIRGLGRTYVSEYLVLYEAARISYSAGLGVTGRLVSDCYSVGINLLAAV